MTLLLDTHALLWLVLDDQRLGEGARRAIRDAERCLVSTVSFWDVANKVALGKLAVDIRALADATARSGLATLDVSLSHVIALAALPLHADHRDPFDRMLVAQARAEGFGLVTRDRKLARYGVTLVGCD